MKSNFSIREKKHRVKDKTDINKRKLIYNIRNSLSFDKIHFAIRDINKYIELYGRDCYINHELGKYYFKTKNYEQAKIEFYNNIENYSENRYYSMYELSKVELFFQNYEQAEKLLKEIIDSDHPQKIHAKIELIKLYDEIDETELELKLIDEVIIEEEFLNEDIRNKGLVFISLINAKIKNNQLSDAKQLLNVYKKQMDEDDIKFLEGEMALCKEQFNNAKNIFEDLVKNGNFYKLKASYELMILEYRSSNFEKVLELANYLLSNGKYHYKDTLMLLSNVYIKYRMNEKAIYYINKLKENNYNDSANLLMGKLYFNNQKYEESIKMFDSVDKKDKKVYQELMYRKIINLIKLNRLQDAYDILDEATNADYNDRYSMKLILIRVYLEKYLNFESTVKINTYTAKQIQNYDKNLALEHIKLHEIDVEEKEVHTIFSDNINVDELYDYCMLNINDDNYYKNTLFDTYILPYDNVGYDGDKSINFVKVVTITNTKQILSIYPYDNYSLNQIEKPKNKKISRIDKFNQKYGIK